jgi:glycosyltransferase involved in cell wall biosynthesis
MRVVHISTYSSVGGAAKAAYRIHSKLLEKGIESDMLVLKGSSDPSFRITVLRESFFYRLKDYFFLRLDNFLFRRHLRKNSLPFSFNYLPRISIRSNSLLKKADIVCLYWVGANFLTPKQIANINKPLVWRFSDKWAFTGNCHLSGDCRQYEKHCGNCPQLTISKEKDFTWYAWKGKFSAWKKKKMTIVAPSSWMESATKNSPIFQDKKIVRIPTGIDHSVFSPVNKLEAKKFWNLPNDKTIILFGANNPFQTLYKGGEFFMELLNKLPRENYFFLVFGSEKNNATEVLPDNIKFLGELESEKELALAYSSADIFICPSIEDNLPNTVLESMACGTPCIAFRDSGGVTDAIDHKRNGYLAEFKNVNDLIDGINWIIEANKSGVISENAVKKILQNFTLEKQVSSLISLYESLLTSKVQKKKTTLF